MDTTTTITLAASQIASWEVLLFPKGSTMHEQRVTTDETTISNELLPRPDHEAEDLVHKMARQAAERICESNSLPTGSIDPENLTIEVRDIFEDNARRIIFRWNPPADRA